MLNRYARGTFTRVFGPLARLLLRLGTFRAGDSDTLADRLEALDLSGVWDRRAAPRQRATRAGHSAA